MAEVFVVAARRTPTGNLLGDLAAVAAADLGAAAIGRALADGGVAASAVDEVILGCVLPAGQGQAPARQAALGAGLPDSVPCTTVNKMCGSAMKAAMIAADQIRAGGADVIVAGGIESMSNAPHLLPGLRRGYKGMEIALPDHLFCDGLQDAYNGELMGVFAQQTADDFNFSREAMDDYAIASLARARAAAAAGLDAREIAPVKYQNSRGAEVAVAADEQPRVANADKIRELKPAFRKDGTVTAANSSSISDGASALILASEKAVSDGGYRPIARIVGQAGAARRPAEFTIAPIDAVRKLMAKINWRDADLFEINEAFAAVAMAATRELRLEPEQVNILGGACARGHPVGASGARIVVTLLNALAHKKQKRGVAALCIGGGEATAMAFEMDA